MSFVGSFMPRINNFMCLDLQSPRSYSLHPYNGSNLRWKIARLMNGHTPRIKRLKSQFRKSIYISEWMHAGPRHDGYCALTPSEYGFHVYVDTTPSHGDLSIYSLREHKRLMGYSYVLLKVEVRGFLRSGTYSGLPCETWKEMKILSIKDLRDS